MAGTNKTNKLIRNGPCIILKDPQLPENIGMCVRSMLNYGFSDLRIVNPKKAFPNDKAISASAGAFDKIIKKTKVFSNLEEAMKSIKIDMVWISGNEDNLNLLITFSVLWELLQ